MPAACGYGCRGPEAAIPCPVMAAIFNLNHHAGYLHWHFITLSVPNLIVVVVMLLVFAAAILLPFPGHTDSGGRS
jgi:hypothetical protein